MVNRVYLNKTKHNNLKEPYTVTFDHKYHQTASEISVFNYKAPLPFSSPGRNLYLPYCANWDSLVATTLKNSCAPLWFSR